jgi:ABC-type Fe3+-citrate transport system substrate-binding protein
VKNLRRDINEALREVSPAYKKANVKYSDSLDALQQIQKSVGTSKDLTGANIDKALGQESRKLISKYGKRVEMMDAIAAAEKAVKQYGGKVEGDITGQVIFANEIDHMFGDVASGSFRAQVRSAAETGLEAATRSKENIAVDLIKGGFKKLRGINEENAIKSIEKLIGE